MTQGQPSLLLFWLLVKVKVQFLGPPQAWSHRVLTHASVPKPRPWIGILVPWNFLFDAVSQPICLLHPSSLAGLLFSCRPQLSMFCRVLSQSPFLPFLFLMAQQRFIHLFLPSSLLLSVPLYSFFPPLHP